MARRDRLRDYCISSGLLYGIQVVSVQKMDTVPCKYCNAATRYTGTGMCDKCWELRWRVRRDPLLAEAFLKEFQAERAGVSEWDPQKEKPNG